MDGFPPTRQLLLLQTELKVGFCRTPPQHAATPHRPVENTPFDVPLIRASIINRSPSAEAAEHLPPILLSDPSSWLPSRRAAARNHF